MPKCPMPLELPSEKAIPNTSNVIPDMSLIKKMEETPKVETPKTEPPVVPMVYFECNGKDFYNIVDMFTIGRGKMFSPAHLELSKQGLISKMVTPDKLEGLFLKYGENLLVDLPGKWYLDCNWFADNCKELKGKKTVKITVFPQSLDINSDGFHTVVPNMPIIKTETDDGEKIPLPVGVDIEPPVIADMLDGNKTWMSPRYDDNGQRMPIEVRERAALTIEFTKKAWTTMFKFAHDNDCDYLGLIIERDSTGKATVKAKVNHLKSLVDPKTVDIEGAEVIYSTNDIGMIMLEGILIRVEAAPFSNLGAKIMLHWNKKAPSVVLTGNNKYGFVGVSSIYFAKGV